MEEYDLDGINPAVRIAEALERIAVCFEKSLSPTAVFKQYVGVADQCLPKCSTNKYDVIA